MWSWVRNKKVPVCKNKICHVKRFVYLHTSWSKRKRVQKIAGPFVVRWIRNLPQHHILRNMDKREIIPAVTLHQRSSGE